MILNKIQLNTKGVLQYYDKSNNMKTKEIIIKILPVLLFFSGMLIGNKNIVSNELYNSLGWFLEISALLIMIFIQKSEISKLKERIKELESEVNSE